MTRDDLISVLLDALKEGRDVRELVLEVTAMPQEYRTCADGCITNDLGGSQQALQTALDGGYALLYEHYDDSEGWGHHHANMVAVLPDGRIIHAEYGGCSCEGHGSWSFVDSLEEGLRMIPEHVREIAPTPEI